MILLLIHRPDERVPIRIKASRIVGAYTVPNGFNVVYREHGGPIEREVFVDADSTLELQPDGRS